MRHSRPFFSPQNTNIVQQEGIVAVLKAYIRLSTNGTNHRVTVRIEW